MKQPVLIGEIIAAILEDLLRHDIDKTIEKEWTDVTDFLRIPCIRALTLEGLMNEGHIDHVRDKSTGRILAKNADLLKYFGTTDFTIKHRRRNGK